ncbi:MAG: EamA family transporter, partial [Pelagibacterales bacterium]|nr:EamA family transporter [Pelagibacterales bacterium]
VFLSYVAYLIPIFAIIWGYLLLSENINYTSIIGIILILFGVYIGRKN